MKNTKFFLHVILLISIQAFSLQAQLEVATNGNVGIGGVAPDSYYDLFSQKAKFNEVLFYQDNYPGIIATSYYNTKSIRPTTNNTCSIGTSSYYFKLIYTTNAVQISDLRTKENIQGINNSLDIIKQLQPIIFDFKTDFIYQPEIEYSDEAIEKEEIHRKNRFGFVAQDVEKVLPNLVYHDDSTSNYGINYTDLIPLLTSAIQEQQKIIEELILEISVIKELKSTQKSLSDIENTSTINEPELYQNIPNPFSKATLIKYKLPQGIKTAFILIHDMTGKQLKTFELKDTGESSITIRAGELNVGMYMYSLLVDNKLVDTKQMILTE